jgi:glycosyltransferase involved in cell wall biosynthesis
MANKKKLLVLSAFYEPYMSGAEQMVKEILEKLGEKYETTLITGRFDRKLQREESRATFRLIRVGIGHPQIDKILYPLLAALRTSSLEPDIVHAIMESYAGGALALIKYFYPKAFRILTLQSGDLDSEKKQKQNLLKLFWKPIHRSAHQVTAISSFLAGRAKMLGVDPENILIIPNGVDLDAIPDNIQKEPGKVLCVARLSWEKGIDTLVKCWPEVAKNSTGARLVLVGEGPERSAIEKMIIDLDLSGSVVLKGNLPHDKVLREMKSAQVFVCPSLAEGLGIVFIEAQACGLPVIGTNVGGIPDVIQNKENGLLVEPGNIEMLTSAILSVLNNKKLADRYSGNALESVKKFNWKHILKEIDSLYGNYQDFSKL